MKTAQLYSKKIVHALLSLFLLITVFSFSVSAQESYLSESSPSIKAEDFKILTLENGFTVFLLEDNSTPMVHVNFTARAGFNCQTPSDAGFYPLYTKLFLSAARKSHEDFFDTVTVTESCNADSASFTADLPYDLTEEYLQILSDCAQTPSFSDESIGREYALMQQQVENYVNTTTGFINSSIDSRVFSSSPWKHDSGVYPALFNLKSVPEVRTELTEIGRRRYTPQNCALFVSGNISSSQLYILAKKYFSSWPLYYKNEAAAFSTETSGNTGSSDNQQKKFVITDSGFSKDFTQIVVQYTSLSLSQCDILNAAFNSWNSPYKKSVLEDPVTAVRSKDYLASGTSSSTSSSRLILQALMEQPYRFTSREIPDEVPSSEVQAELFLSHIKESAVLSKTDFQNAKNEISSKYRTQFSSSKQAVELLSGYWSLIPDYSADGFLSRYSKFLNYSQQELLEDLTEAFQEEEPFVFVLLNDSNYESCIDDFEKNGWSHITRENASWYNDQIKLAEILRKKEEEKNSQSKFSFAGIKNAAAVSPAEAWCYTSSAAVSTSVLSNGIPLAVKYIPGSESVSVSIGISGGESASPENEKYLRTVMINYFSVNIQAQINSLKRQGKIKGSVEIKARTFESASAITMNCTKEDFPLVMECASSAIIYGDIQPSVADSLVYRQKSQWGNLSSDTEYQMMADCYSQFYSGTGFEKIWKEDEILKDTTYYSISRSYMDLLDASLYFIAVSGDLSMEEAMVYSQQSLGLLKEQTQRSMWTIPSPSIKKRTAKFQLRHIYATDIPVELAPEESPLLIPSKDFRDPIQFYFPSPSDDSLKELFNALLLELKVRMEREMGSGENTARKRSIYGAGNGGYIESNGDGSYIISIKEADDMLPFGGIKIRSITHTSSFLNAWKKTVASLTADLKNPDTAAKTVSAIKAKWNTVHLSQTLTGEGNSQLLLNSLMSGKPLEFYDGILSVDHADSEALLYVLNQFIPADPDFKAYSADSQK